MEFPQEKNEESPEEQQIEQEDDEQPTSSRRRPSTAQVIASWPSPTPQDLRTQDSSEISERESARLTLCQELHHHHYHHHHHQQHQQQQN